jgi:hypothetical protein
VRDDKPAMLSGNSGVLVNRLKLVILVSEIILVTKSGKDLMTMIAPVLKSVENVGVK